MYEREGGVLVCVCVYVWRGEVIIRLLSLHTDAVQGELSFHKKTSLWIGLMWCLLEFRLFESAVVLCECP